MAITDISISEELMTNAPSIKYRGNEGPKSPQEIEMMMMSGGQPLPEDPTKPVNPFAPKPTGPVLPDKMMAGTDTPEIEIEMLQELLKLFREKFNRDPVSIDELKRAIGQMREKAAYGGIMGLDGRKRYGIGSFFQDLKDKVVDDLIPNELKDNPELAAAAALVGANYFDVIPGSGSSKGYIGDLFSKLPDSVKEAPGKVKDFIFEEDEKGDSIAKNIGSSLAKNIVPILGGVTAGLFTKNQPEQPGLPDDTTALNLADLKKGANLATQEQGLAAGLNFLPAVSARKFTPEEMAITYAQSAANGGRIGFSQGLSALPQTDILSAGPRPGQPRMKIMTQPMMITTTDLDKPIIKNYYSKEDSGRRNEAFFEIIDPRTGDMSTISEIDFYEKYGKPNAYGGRIGRAEGGIMDLGGMEKDYRAEGGFVPIGKEEKADDVPARLSVNEFVFTADAVRNAGGGDIDQGARVMENMMKHLEAGGQVSRESQGMQGARDMFEVSERLSEVV